MTDILDLERRVIALEAASSENTKTLNWVVGTLGRLAADVSAVKEDVKEVKSGLHRLENDFNTFRRDLPAMMAETMREVLREHKGGA